MAHLSLQQRLAGLEDVDDAGVSPEKVAQVLLERHGPAAPTLITPPAHWRPASPTAAPIQPFLAD
jgi:hypothetical protein